MRPVICFGEALIDFLNTGGDRDGPLTLPTYRQYPGGAPANASVAIAKLGGNALFAGQIGDDAFGTFIRAALDEYGVDTRFLATHPTAKTALAFVLLDKDGDRSFAFHRDQTADTVFRKEQIDSDWFAGQPIFHFCSNTLTDRAIADVTQHAITLAAAAGATISFDINLRHNLWPDNAADRDQVTACVHRAHLLKFASEELDYLANGKPQDYLQRCIDNGAQLIVVTDGGAPIHFVTAADTGYVDCPAVKAVDTTAAGDAFSGALLYGLSRADSLAALIHQPHQLSALLNFALHCSALTVTRPGAFPALPTFDEVESHWKDLS